MKHSLTLPVSMLAGALFLGALLWTSGCDFTHVDEPAHVPIKQILVELESAETPPAAEVALGRLLGKLEIGVPGKDGAYSAYGLGKEGRTALARAHAAYVKDGANPAETFREAYEVVRRIEAEAREVETFAQSRRPSLDASVEEVLRVLQASVGAALADAERPGSALLVMLAATRGEIPAQADAFDADAPLSPVQRFLFGIWLHQNAPAMTVRRFEEGAAKSMGNCSVCPANYVLIDKFECASGNREGCDLEVEGGRPKGTGTVVIQNETFKVENGRVDGVASLSWSSPTYEIDYVALNPGCYQEFVPRRTSGTLSYQSIARKAFSNLVFCAAGDRNTCRTKCEAAYASCTFSSGTYAGTDCNKLQACLDACEHPQGNFYNP